MPSKKDVVLGVLGETGGNVKAALERLSARGVSVDRSYVYEIRRELANGAGGRRQSSRGKRYTTPIIFDTTKR